MFFLFCWGLIFLEVPAKQKRNAMIIPEPAFILEFIIWLAFIGAMMVKCFYFQFSTRLNSRPFFTPFNTNMLLATFTSVLLIVAFTFLISNKKRLIALVCINFLLSLLLFGDIIYFRYYYNALSVPVLYQIGLVGSLKESILNLLRIEDLVFFIDIPVVIVCLRLFKQAFHMKITKINILKKLVTAGLIFVIGFGIFQWTYGKTSPGSFPFDNNYVSDSLGVLYFHYYDIKNFVVEHFLTDNSLSEEERRKIDEYYKGRQAGEEKYRGAAKGKNLIVVQLEAVQQFMINRKVNGKEITPNLNRFINDSAYFDNFYFQTGNGNTADAEFLTNTSLYPTSQGSAYFRFPTNTYESTAKLLKNQGYNTYAAHANNPSFWNRTEMYKSLGFDTFISNKSLEIDDTIGWGLTDKSFLRQSLEKIDTAKPFYGFFITLSSHYPFDFFKGYAGFYAGKYEDTFLGNYIKAVSYVDEALGGFFNDLKRRGLYDNSVIVVYGDHAAIQKYQFYTLKELTGFNDNEFNWVKFQKTPCFIRFPGMDNTGVKKITAGEIDILPTIANLMGFDAPHALGKDLFNTDSGYAVLRDSAVITDDFTYTGGSDGKVYDNSGAELNKKDYKDIIKEYQKQLDISDLILLKDGLKP
ncbi:MAG: LTA synthase family protein [Ruminiclostridium sp.]|nr:LTA synthase family protein [Ruminiclostridium sp.]